jgi:AbrB family looped-hinge helix DNA binding protein
MQVTIDKAGRVLVPKPIRDRFGLREDCQLELEEGAEGIVLKPVASRPRLERRPSGRLVFTSQVQPDIDWDHLIQDMREERIRKIGGW